jgi:DNA-binding NtrC family response regulator
MVARLGGQLPAPGDLGPVKTLVDLEAFDEIRLLSNYPAAWNKKYKQWLGHRATIVAVELEKPTDYPAIFKLADAELAALPREVDSQAVELCIHLSPGTPAMAAVWVLLGKTRYAATFFETHRGRSWKTDIPFDLTLDVLPELLRGPDSKLLHLAAQSPSQVEGFEDIIGDSPAIRLAVGRAKRAALRGVGVLLLGESGTGKELFAQAMHRASPRRKGPFVAVNCATFSRELLESELFGHAKGAYTGAVSEHAGAFAQADGGTLFLDEVGECDLGVQAKLLRVLQPPPGAGPCQRAFRRLGDERESTSDVRVIAATNRELRGEINEGRFREDLYHRLAVITIALPPLRERKSDIETLAVRLLEQINAQFQSEEPGYQYKKISPDAISFVKRHRWPGNVRQLYNVLLQAAVMAEGDCLDRADSAGSDGAVLDHSLGDGFAVDDLLNRVHAHYLRRAMRDAGGNKTKAARLLGVDNYQTLSNRLKALKVKGPWK